MYDFIDSWTGNPEVIKKLKNYFSNYLSQFKNDESILVCKLFEKIKYYSEDNLDTIKNKYFDILRNLLIRINKKYIVCTPNMTNQINKNTNKIISFCPKDIVVQNNILDMNLSNVDIIVILDDYCGGGSTIRCFLNELTKKIIGRKKIIYYPMFIVGKTLVSLQNDKYEKIEFIIHSYIINLAFCLSDNAIFSSDEVAKFIILCQKLGIPKEYLFGYDYIEDNFSTKYFTPNNSLGILWYSKKLYKPFFNRNGQDYINKYRYLTKNKRNEFRRIIKSNLSEENRELAKITLLLYEGFSIKEINDFMGISNSEKLIEKLLYLNILGVNNDCYNFGVNAKLFFNTQYLDLYRNFGNVITKEDEIVLRLLSLIEK